MHSCALLFQHSFCRKPKVELLVIWDIFSRTLDHEIQKEKAREPDVQLSGYPVDEFVQLCIFGEFPEEGLEVLSLDNHRKLIE